LWDENQEVDYSFSSTVIPEVYAENATLAFNISSSETDFLKGEQVYVEVFESYSFITQNPADSLFYKLKSREFSVQIETYRTKKE